jgi:hypothetical protein
LGRVVQQLQHNAGNAAVERLLAIGELQAKLLVGPAGDRYEREADDIARRVVRRLGQAPDGVDTEAGIRRKVTAGPNVGLQGGSLDGASERDVRAALRGGGTPLPAHTRRSMEGAFGTGFSRVRVHTDATAGEMARSLSAEAFTYGHDVFFAPQRYDPHSMRGQETLAHELAHVVQQERGAGAASGPSTPGATAEASVSVSRRAPRATVQRRKGIPADKMVQVFRNKKRWYGQVAETDDAQGNYRIRVDEDESADIRKVHERYVELHPDHHGPKDWQGERTLGALTMQTGSVEELETDGTGSKWADISAELSKPDPKSGTNEPKFLGFPVELCTVYYSPKTRKLVLTRDGKRDPVLMGQVVDYLEQFMEANGQWPYIERQAWYTQGTHVIAIEVNYYSDRKHAQASLGFHKDTAGDNIFVNLIFDNERPIAATEWYQDVEPQGKATSTHQSKLQPGTYRDELEEVRMAGLYMFGRTSEIKGGVTKGAHSYVSWVDDAVWHATPYPEKRAVRSAADVKAEYDKFDGLSRREEARTKGSAGFDQKVQQHEASLSRLRSTYDALKVEFDRIAAELGKLDDSSDEYRQLVVGEYSPCRAKIQRIVDTYKFDEGKLKSVEARRGVYFKWINVLGTLGEWDGTHLERWLKAQKRSVRDVESWALKAWQAVYSGKKPDFEHDVDQRASHPWRETPGPAEAIAEEKKVGSKSMKQVPPTASQRQRSNSLNLAAVKQAFTENKDIPRRFIRTWVRMVPVDAKEIARYRKALVPPQKASDETH